MSNYTQLCFNPTKNIVDTDFLFDMTYKNTETGDTVKVETGSLKSTNGKEVTVNLFTDSNVKPLVDAGILEADALNGKFKLAERIWLDCFMFNGPDYDEDTGEEKETFYFTDVNLEFSRDTGNTDLMELKVLCDISGKRINLEAVINTETGDMTYISNTPFTIKFYEERV